MNSSRSRFRVALIGRPNVGKSSLFNFLTRSRRALVKNEPGVTRDIITGTADWWGKSFEVLDTGGLTRGRPTDERKASQFSALIYEQVMSVLKYVDLLIVMMDAKTGLVPEDRDVVRIANESGKPFFVVLNKVDREKDAELLKSEFYELGVDVLHASVERRDHTDAIVEKIIAAIPEGEVVDDNSIRIAVIGKPNAGKSSIVNAILGERRVLVSATPGTTVDAIEEKFEYEYRGPNGSVKQALTFIDTAGLRRQGKRLGGRDEVEILSAYKSFDAIDRADLVLLVVDSVLGPAEQDAHIVEYSYEKAKAVIVVANKFDLLKAEHDQPKKWFRERLDFVFHFAPDVPVVFTTAVGPQNVRDLLDEVVRVAHKLEFKVSTRELNDFFYEVIRQAPAPVYRTTNVKFYYLTQTEQRPPSFIAFANHPEGVTPAYRKFLINRIQKQWGLEGVPVRVFVMKSK